MEERTSYSASPPASEQRRTELDTSVLTKGLQPLNPRVRNVWMLKRSVLAGLLIGGALIYDLLHLFQDSPLPPFVPTVLAVLLGVLFAVVVPRWAYKKWRYALRAEELFLEHGILNHVRTVVPLRRIQHLDVSQDVFEREFDLGKLVVHTAGTRSGTVMLPGLRYADAEHLRDAIRQYVRHSDDAF